MLVQAALPGVGSCADSSASLKFLGIFPPFLLTKFDLANQCRLKKCIVLGDVPICSLVRRFYIYIYIYINNRVRILELFQGRVQSWSRGGARFEI